MVDQYIHDHTVALLQDARAEFEDLQSQLDSVCEELEKTKSELKRYREREPLVQKLIDWIAPGDPESHGLDELPKFWRSFVAGLDERARGVRGFKLSASAAAGDESS